MLKFSEVYFDKQDDKIFDVKLGDHYIARDLDPFAKAGGKYLPYDMFQELFVRQGKVYIDSKEVRNAVRTNSDGTKALQVEFKVGKADNPKVNAILLVKGDASNTHKDSFTKF